MLNVDQGAAAPPWTPLLLLFCGLGALGAVRAGLRVAGVARIAVTPPAPGPPARKATERRHALLKLVDTRRQRVERVEHPLELTREPLHRHVEALERVRHARQVTLHLHEHRHRAG